MSKKENAPATYCETKTYADDAPEKPSPIGWKELYVKEDWWAIYLGIGIMALAIIAFLNGSTIVRSLTVNPGGLKWSSPDILVSHFSQNAHLYALQLLSWLVIFGISTRIMGIKTSRFIPSFIILYLLSIIMFSIGGWVDAPKYNLDKRGTGRSLDEALRRAKAAVK